MGKIELVGRKPRSAKISPKKVERFENALTTVRAERVQRERDRVKKFSLFKTA
ncbi:hypothetical protein ACIOJF_15090 [Glutamicibacter sp. NPDC087831]|uniref:hypothetical protein n=1 Tax=Glutamicibacter sp. NPDC087831 TaxID=3363998 RepID=UPI00382BF046